MAAAPQCELVLVPVVLLGDDGACGATRGAWFMFLVSQSLLVYVDLDTRRVRLAPFCQCMRHQRVERHC
jgi:hypothetical protein